MAARRKKQNTGNKKRRGKPSNRQRWFRFAFYLTGAIAGLLLLLYALTIMGIFGKIPDQDELKKITNYTATEVYSSDNVLLGRYYVQNRTNTNLSEISDFFLTALIATEDARFYKHKGIDTRSTLRVLIKSVLLFDKDAGGGSTISQQLAKNLYPRKRLGPLTLPVAKIREISIARRLEKVYSKEEILELYLNTVPFGDNTYGIETAALVYFSKKPGKLKPEESAVLVGMLKGNTYYNPRVNPGAAKERRNIVFNQMVRYNYLERSAADSLMALPLIIKYRKLVHDEGPAPYFREYLRHELEAWCRKNPRPDGSRYNIYTDGLRIYTTIDSRLQSFAEQALRQHLKKLQGEFDAQWSGSSAPWVKNISLANREITQSKAYLNLKKKGLSHEEIIEEMKLPSETKILTSEGEVHRNISSLDSILHHFGMLHAGFLSVEAQTGFVKAWVGGINYKYFKYDHVLSRRQPGSTFKPFVYSVALEEGAKPCDFFPNDSVVYTQYDNWVPRNAERNYGGYYSMKGALTHSVNTVSAKLLMESGPRKVVKLAEDLGFEGELPEVPSLALGTGTASLYELVRAYAVFVNRGRTMDLTVIRRIEDQKGHVIYVQPVQKASKPVIDPMIAEQILAMLKEVADRGTAASLHSVYGLNAEIAGKTGTSQKHTDGWFIGMTPDLVTGVWVGGDNPLVRFNSLYYGQGSHMALPVFARYMQKIYKDSFYGPARESSFNLSDEVLASLDCEDFREEEFDTIMDFLDKTEESIGNFIKRIFKRKDKSKNRENSEKGEKGENVESPDNN